MHDRIFSAISVGLSIFILCTVWTSAAVPVNDDFANRIVLEPGMQWSGNTEGATRETRELYPPLFSLTNGGTVWFTWTAPASGWFHLSSWTVEVWTTTYIAAWRGETLTSLKFVHGADHDFILNAVAGDTFQFSLSVEPVWGTVPDSGIVIGPVNADPRFEVTAFSMNPPVVDTADAEQTVQLTFEVSDDHEWPSPVLIASGPGFYREVDFGENQLAWGTMTRGTFTVPLKLPQGMNAQEVWFSIYWLGKGSIQDAAGMRTRQPFSLTDVPSLKVLNTGRMDTLPPMLTEFSVTPMTVDTSPPVTSMSFTARAADTLSGVSSVQVELFNAAGENVSGYAFCDERSRVVGNSHDGVYNGSIQFYRDKLPGEYRLLVSIYDFNGNSGTYGRDGNPFPGLFNGTITVTRDLANAHYAAWCATAFGPGADPALLEQSADPDGDGMKNLMEYALGLNPLARDAWDGTELVTRDGVQYFRYTRPMDRKYITYNLLRSSSLAGRWSRVPQLHFPNDSGNGKGTVYIPVGRTAQEGYQFFRLQVDFSG